MQPYERFQAWQESHDLVLAVYRETSGFPSSERYGLTSQSRRAAFSVAANLVEGSARPGRREFARFLAFSLSSLAELGYALRLARDLEYLTHEAWKSLENQRNLAGKLLWGLYASMRTREGRK